MTSDPNMVCHWC